MKKKTNKPPVTLESIDRKFVILDRKIDSRFTVLDGKIDDRFNVLDRKIDDKFNVLDRKIDDRFNVLDRKIDDRFNVLDKKFDELSGDVVSEVKKIVEFVDGKFEGVNNRINFLGKRIDDVLLDKVSYGEFKKLETRVERIEKKAVLK